MQKIRFIEETNGQINGSLNGVRYKGRDVYEDRVHHNPTKPEPRLYTMIHNYNGDVRRRGKWDRNRVIAEYPNARGFSYIVKDTGKVYKAFTVRKEKHRDRYARVHKV